MNFFRRTALKLALKGVDLSLTSPEGWGMGGTTWAKVAVNDSTQLQISAAFSAIKLITETIGAMPLHLYEKKADGSREKALNHPLYELIHGAPNQYMTAVDFKEAIATSIVTQGISYNYVERFKSTGRVISITPVHKSKVTHEVRNDGTIIYRLSRRNGQQTEHDRIDLCPIRGFGGVGEIEGYAPHRIMPNAYALAIAVEKYGSDFFGSGGRPLGLLTTEHEFKAEQRDAIRENFQKYVLESWQSGKMPLLERSTKYQQITTANNEAQFIETRKHQIAEIARIYRVPMHMLMEMDRATYANAEQENSQFLNYTLSPYLVRIQTGLNAGLLSADDKKKFYFEFDTKGILRGDSQQRAIYYKDMRTAGAMTQNEIRALENLPRIDGGDDLHVPLNMAPVGQLSEILTGGKNG